MRPVDGFITNRCDLHRRGFEHIVDELAVDAFVEHIAASENCPETVDCQARLRRRFGGQERLDQPLMTSCHGNGRNKENVACLAKREKRRVREEGERESFVSSARWSKSS